MIANIPHTTRRLDATALAFGVVGFVFSAYAAPHTMLADQTWSKPQPVAQEWAKAQPADQSWTKAQPADQDWSKSQPDDESWGKSQPDDQEWSVS
jgi:hypothetical protein